MQRIKPGIASTVPSDVTGRKLERMYTVRYHLNADKAAAADVDAVHVAVDGTSHELIADITNPPTPRNITATAGGTAGNIKAVQVVIEGTDYDGKVITETLPAFTVDTAGTVSGNKAFKTVTKVTIPAHDAASATTSIGFGEKIGLPYKLPHNTVQAAYLNNVKESTAPTVTTSETDLASNTVDLNSALNGSPVDIYLWV
ncbi:hypothetical protein [Paenibacillus whitsoniae]|uniref:Uncharacterized protein n=1 Tax=Paenibacillus whitsoniae TaxID=2496558 RepID=A0A430J7H1_9BACL|nr:hypothetical protein [Paenibacillus whitsoniae]RTE05495.1 hypothetical protein EJQ19_25060 [Paenibacillus whitsoniae]